MLYLFLMSFVNQKKKKRIHRFSIIIWGGGGGGGVDLGQQYVICLLFEMESKFISGDLFEMNEIDSNIKCVQF